VNGDPSFIGTTLAKNAAKIQAARLISARLTAPSDINWPKYAMSFPPKTGAGKNPTAVIATFFHFRLSPSNISVTTAAAAQENKNSIQRTTIFFGPG